MPRLSQNHQLPHAVETLTVAYTVYLTTWTRRKGMLEQQNTPVALEETAIQELVSRMRGELLRPSDAGYEQAIRVYNGMIEKRPALIAHCVDVADVIAAVNFAREQGLTLAVRGGGHSGPGLGTCDDGLVIDLSGMKGIRVDPSARTARVEGGCTCAEVDHSTHAFVLATPSGFVSTTGAGWLAFITVPPAPPFPEQFHLQKMCAIVWCSTAPMERAEELLKPIRAFRTPAVDFAGPIPWPVLQSLFDALYPAGLQWYWKADFFKDLSDKAIDLHMKYSAHLPTMHSTMHIYPINGATHRPSTSDTAFSFRDANFAEVIVGVDPDPANNERMIQWARDYWMALHPYSAGGGYVNMMMDEGTDNVKAAYRDNYARLAQIKARYDPSNLFHVNQNITPTR